jgi:hypothetical protein
MRGSAGTSTLQQLASRVAAAVAREAYASARAPFSTKAPAASAAAAAPLPPPPTTVTVRGLGDGSTSASSSTAAAEDRRAESIALLRRFNVAILPELRGQTILARVVRASRHELLLDPGYSSLCTVPRAGVVPAAVAAAATAVGAAESLPSGATTTTGPSSSSSNSSSSQVRVGDFVRVRLSELYTPYGDPQLDPVRTSRAARDKLVWQELERRMRQGAPVGGRVLNACAGGYAVGVGGYVALLRTEQAPAEVVRAVGVLQPFYVHKMSRGGGGGGAGGGGRRGANGRRGGPGRIGGNEDRPLIELTCTSQRAAAYGVAGLYSNV